VHIEEVISLQSQHLTGQTKGNKKKGSVTIASYCAKIQTLDLPNMRIDNHKAEMFSPHGLAWD